MSNVNLGTQLSSLNFGSAAPLEPQSDGERLIRKRLIDCRTPVPGAVYEADPDTSMLPGPINGPLYLPTRRGPMQDCLPVGCAPTDCAPKRSDDCDMPRDSGVRWGTVTVRPGDDLSSIARAHGTTWQHVYDANRDVIPDPNLIHPGQRLRVPTGETWPPADGSCAPEATPPTAPAPAPPQGNDCPPPAKPDCPPSDQPNKQLQDAARITGIIGNVIGGIAGAFNGGFGMVGGVGRPAGMPIMPVIGPTANQRLMINGGLGMPGGFGINAGFGIGMNGGFGGVGTPIAGPVLGAPSAPVAGPPMKF